MPNGSDIALGARNPRTGRFPFAWDDGGDVRFDDTEEHAVMQALVCRRDAYWADKAVGSRLQELRSITRTTSSLATAYAFEALQPLVELKRIRPPSVDARSDRTNFRTMVSATWSTPGGRPGTTRVAL